MSKSIMPKSAPQKPYTSKLTEHFTESSPLASSLILLSRPCILALALLGIFSLMRVAMVEAYLPSEMMRENPSDMVAMWLMGAKLDMRSISIALVVLLALSYIVALCAYAVRMLLKLPLLREREREREMSRA